MAAALRTSYRSLNKKSDAYLEMIALHRFHEGRNANNYEVARRHLKVCEQTCTRLRSAGDLSVCYWTLAELASNKQYYSKASMFYEKAIHTYSSPKMLEQFQPSLSAIYAHYSYALAGRDRLLPQSQPHLQRIDEHRPNPQSEPEQPIIRSSSVDEFEPRAPSPTPEGASDVDENSTVTPTCTSPSGSVPIGSDSSQQSSEPATGSDIDDDCGTYDPLGTLSDYENDIQWPDGQQCELELEEVGANGDHGIHDIVMNPDLEDSELLTHLQPTVRLFLEVHGNQNPPALVS